MTFAELPLFAAINDAYAVFEHHRSEDWLYIEANRKKLHDFIRSRLPMDYHARAEEMFRAWVNFGKSKTVSREGQPKMNWAQLVVQIYLRDGGRCFYSGRGVGECSHDVSIDRIRPGSRGGAYVVENCLLCCDIHNSARGDSSIEEYLVRSNPNVLA